MRPENTADVFVLDLASTGVSNRRNVLGNAAGHLVVEREAGLALQCSQRVICAVKEKLLRKLMVFLLGVVLCWSGVLPACAKAKAKLNPEARAAQKRNKDLQKTAKKQAKAKRREIRRLRASR